MPPIQVIKQFKDDDTIHHGFRILRCRKYRLHGLGSHVADPIAEIAAAHLVAEDLDGQSTKTSRNHRR